MACLYPRELTTYMMILKEGSATVLHTAVKQCIACLNGRLNSCKGFFFFVKYFAVPHGLPLALIVFLYSVAVFHCTISCELQEPSSVPGLVAQQKPLLLWNMQVECKALPLNTSWRYSSTYAAEKIAWLCNEQMRRLCTVSIVSNAQGFMSGNEETA